MNKRIIVALDYPEKSAALEFIEQIDPSLCRLKVGKEMFTRLGPNFVSYLVNSGYDVFLDLKFHDIPHTVAQAVKAAADLGVWMVDLHASGGYNMMQAAKQALQSFGENAPKLIAVTVLTSMSEEDFSYLKCPTSIPQQVMLLAKLAHKSGLDGVVCSAREAAQIRQQLPHDFNLVTPGIRPLGSNKDDQKRVVTPSEAIKNGANYLVIGRPITQSADPLQKLKTLNFEIES